MTQSDHIFDCLTKNNLRQIKLLLDGGCDVDITDKYGRTLLMTSLVHITDVDTRVRMIKQLMQRGADINKTDKNGKCALTYSCVLNQVGTVKLLLVQDKIDPNIPDIHGATPLMHAASLGHVDVIKVMMEYQRNGTVTIEMKARDDNGNSVMDHAKNDKNVDCLNKPQQRQFAVNSRKVQNVLESYSENTGSIDKSNKGGEEGIELKDLKNTLNRKQTDGKSTKNSVQKSESNTNKSVNFSNVPPEIRASCIRRWAADLKDQHEDSGRLSSLMSPSTTSTSRPGSRQDIMGRNSAKQRAPSSLSTASKSNNFLEKPNAGGDDEDDDFSLESLSDLVGTVRQYAQEIREIYAPIQKEEEERTTKRKEKITKRKGKKLQKTFVSTVGNAKNLAPPPVHEVCVEIHKPEDHERQKNPGFTQSRSYDPSSTRPLASLHVENEQLSSTWPRGRQRARSEDRNRSLKDKSEHPDTYGSKMSVVSAPGPSNSHSRPQIPPDWNEKVSLEHEREILNNAFKRINNSNEDPLLKSISENKKNMKLRQSLANSRQSVIQMGKHHQTAGTTTTTTNEVPSISIIPPPPDSMGSSHLARHERFHNEMEMMSGGRAMPDNVINIESRGKMPRESKNGGNGVKSSTKGLRRRRSVEQGLGQPPAIDKY